MVMLLRRDKEVGVPTPMNDAIVGLMKKVENGEANPDPSALKQLKAYLLT